MIFGEGQGLGYRETAGPYRGEDGCLMETWYQKYQMETGREVGAPGNLTRVSLDEHESPEDPQALLWLMPCTGVSH